MIFDRIIDVFILLQILPKNIAVLATTATATNRVIAEVEDQLGECEIIRGDLQRDSLHLHKLFLPTADKLPAAIQFALSDRVVANAKTLSKKIANENGAKECVDFIAKCL